MTRVVPQRKHPVHPVPIVRHNLPTVLFVTVCAENGNCVFASDIVQAALREIWTRVNNWRVGDYMIMPDHIHFFCIPGETSPPNIQKWAKYWKREVGTQCPGLRGQWQPDCWDTQMRNLAHYEEKLAYMRMNPVRRNLARTPEEWPYQGRVFEIRW
jgi:putative transposase